MENNREQWSSKASFILAAAGSVLVLEIFGNFHI